MQKAISSILGAKGFADYKRTMQSLYTDIQPRGEKPARPPPEED